MNDQLWSTDTTGFYSVGCSAATFARLQTTLQEQRPSAVVRTIDGNQSRTQDDFFAAFAAALDFPSYFGRNWHAIDDMLLDMTWLRGSAYVLLFADAHLLMDDAEPESLEALARHLLLAHDSWQMVGMPVSDVQPVPFHAVFQAPPQHLAALTERLTAAGFAMDSAWPGTEVLD